MNTSNNRRLVLLLLAGVVTLIALYVFRGQEHNMPPQGGAVSDTGSNAGSGSATERKVLYWHDPMVPGFKSDKPGKSPFMDMELVPVYADEASAGIQVRPEVSSSLGIRLAKVARLRPTLRLSATGYLTTGGPSASALVDLYDRAADAVRAGQRAEVSIASLAGAPLQATVTQVSRDFGIGARGAKATLRITSRQGAPHGAPQAPSRNPPRAGDLVNAEIVIPATRTMLIVPAEAVIRAGDAPRVVRALDEGRFESVTVVAGESYHEGIAILRGLAEGDRIVVSGQFLLDSESGARAGFGRMENAGGDRP